MMKLKVYLLIGVLLLTLAAAAQPLRQVDFMPQVARGDAAVRGVRSRAAAWEAPKTAFVKGDAIGVFATAYSDAVWPSATPFGNFMRNVPVTRYASGWYYDDLKLWQTGDKLAVFAYYPYDPDVQIAASAAEPGAPVMTYTPAANIRDQQDLLYCGNKHVADLSTPIPLPFSHALAQLRFRANKAKGFLSSVVITKILLVDITAVGGDFNLSTASWGNFTGNGDCPTVTVGLTSYRVVYTADELTPTELLESSVAVDASHLSGILATDGTLQEVVGVGQSHGFLVIPAANPSAKLLVYYSLAGVPAPLPQVVPLPGGTAWSMGKPYVYSFQLKAPTI